MTYLILNLLFLLTVFFVLPKKLKKPARAFWITLAVVLVLTALFDPLIVALDIVAYNPEHTLELTFFGAPVEDFFYALYAAILVPLVWHRLEERESRS